MVDDVRDKHGDRFERFTEYVYKRELPQRIVASVRRDGVFVLDLTNWEPGKPVTIPSVSPRDPPQKQKDVLAAIEQERDHLARRVEAVNAYLACLYSCKGSPEPVYHIYNSYEHISLRSLDDKILTASLNDTYSPLQTFITIHTDFERYISGERARGILCLDLIKESFDLYEGLLSCKLNDSLTISVLLLRAANHCAEHDFPSCVIFSWVVCERLINILWEGFIDTNRTRTSNGQSVPFINNGRKGRLENSTAYTAAVKVEFLTFNEMIPFDLYEDLSITRKARNEWAHGLKSLDYGAAARAIRVAQALLGHVAGVHLHITPGAQARLTMTN